jgi:ATP-dependent helicase YprA (DUF1998 family)
MDVFDLRHKLVTSYASYIRSFIQIRDARINAKVKAELESGLLWPEPLIQLNPSFEPGRTIDQLVDEGLLHPTCRRVFRIKKTEAISTGQALTLHRHQEEAVRTAQTGANYVLTTGTGSGKSLAYIIPIVDHVLRKGSGGGVSAIVVYPMNALANSQHGELEKFLRHGFGADESPVRFATYTGQEKQDTRDRIIANPPDILLTNYVMLELLLTRPEERDLIESAKGLRFLVLDELHTYRGRQGSDVAMLVRRVRDRLQADQLQRVGTSATLSSAGTLDQQRVEIARVASNLFGAEVAAGNVLGETLRRATAGRDLNDPKFRTELTRRLTEDTGRPPASYEEFVSDPLSIWIESTFGLRTEEETGRLVRALPRSIDGKQGAAEEVSKLTGVAEGRCAQAIRRGLLSGYDCQNPATGFPAFAFRIHQFVSRGDTVYATVEDENTRYVTVQGQQFVPGDRDRLLLPLAFCRECGQEYYSVRMTTDAERGRRVFTPRAVNDSQTTAGEEAGFLYVSAAAPWPTDPDQQLSKLPDDWIEEHQGKRRVRSGRHKELPRPIRVGPDASESDDGFECHFLPAPFRFCLHCGVSYGFRLQSDFGKLATLSSEGRSTATTILSLTTIRELRRQTSSVERARKLLSFTDNRQDASLQAGHFNDFVEIAQLRSALYTAASRARPDGITHEILAQKVFDALNLPLELYASDPAVRFAAAAETGRALRDVLAYRLYRDLRRGWRVTAPNLEQCGLLEIRYQSLDDVSAAQDVWADKHDALASATPSIRREVAKVLLDFMRRSLAIKVDYLERTAQERMQQLSSQRLRPPWGLDENERLDYATILYPRSLVGNQDDRQNIYLSPRGGFGQYLGRPSTFPSLFGSLALADRLTVISDLLEALRVAGLVEIVDRPRTNQDVAGYQVPAAAIVWVAGDGTRAFHDPIAVPSLPETGGRTNPFFVDFYQTVATELLGLEAREHTAQVPNENRIDREERFRSGSLPVLFCSPTMELGVDIAELNVVNMRNIPPTPANYAQRSGRAGRSGQPAFVFSYCATGSPHDQYFFNRPYLMVAGAVTPPRMDLANEDLIRAHVHAIWLAETRQRLGISLKDILDLTRQPELPLNDSVRESLAAQLPRERTHARAKRVLTTLEDELRRSDWYTDSWLEDAINQAMPRFDAACNRWRGLYRSAMAQRDLQNRIIGDASRKLADKERAKLLRQEAESQLELLTEASNIAQADFYSYRYFASEGFLPGYNFPRLPLSAYIPARRAQQTRDEFVSRPRFLAISEFGPRSILYHEGSRYQINRVILPVEESERLPTEQIKLCPKCGYLHPMTGAVGPDCCDRCEAQLGPAMQSLFRLQNVSTKRRERINCDEEERLRLGYQIQTAVRFAEQGGRPSYRTATVEYEQVQIAKMAYGQAATLWRINLGENRRKIKEQLGFVLDVERGYWARSEQVADEGDEPDPLTPKTARVIPFVEDRRNALLIEFKEPYGTDVIATLQAALKNAIQVRHQLEDGELAIEPLPTREQRRLILIYESSEGGAGVLRRLVEDPQALPLVAREALKICHFDPDTGRDLRRREGAREDCEAACYDCLMSYSNQPDHSLLDRQAIKPILSELAQAHVAAAPRSSTREEHLEGLLRRAGSELEREWLRFLDARQHRLPSGAQELIAAAQTRPDFVYGEHYAVIYIDGPVHLYADRQRRDLDVTERLEDLSYTVIRFGHQDDWTAIIARYPSLFGAGRQE